VKVIFLTSGLLVISSPISCAEPITKFRTPLGKFASWKHLNISIADNGVIAAGFNTDVQPAAMAGANLRVIIDKGKFQGVIAAHTPMGFFNTIKCFSVCDPGITSLYILLASSAYHFTYEIAPLTSFSESEKGFPFSIVILSANSSLLSFISDATFDK